MNEEKDRFGELMRLLERAQEDIYFSAKDRELIEKLKAQVQTSPNAQLEAPFLICPRCKEKLLNSTLRALPVSRCQGCGGVWLDSGTLDEFLKEMNPVRKKSLISRFTRKRAA